LHGRAGWRTGHSAAAVGVGRYERPARLEWGPAYDPLTAVGEESRLPIPGNASNTGAG
jgi:hypothetical protein